MKTWLRLLLITMTVGGGYTGIVLTITLFRSLNTPLQLLLIITFLILFSFVFAAGLLFVQNPKRTGPLLAALALQIPWVSSPQFVYQFVTGVYSATTLGTPENSDRLGVHFGWNLNIGAHFLFRLGSYEDVPLTIGINVVALILFIILFRFTQSSKAKQHAEIPILKESAELQK